MSADYNTPQQELLPSFNYMESLNDSQRHAVETTQGPVLILAGAGTGKTKALTTRIAHIIHSNLATPYNILAVTFTNKAAKEMQERVSQIVPHISWTGSWLGTFHSISARMLRRHANLADLNQNFVIINQDDQLRLIKQLLSEFRLDQKETPPKLVLSMISKWKDKGLRPHQVGANEARDIAGGRLCDIYKIYQERLLQLNACDFSDLLLHMITIFQNHRHVLQQYHAQFKYVLVDEYQDTNIAQYLWLRLLAQGHHNICCVGDDDQSIYGWRGAEVDNILRFEKDFPGAEIIRLEQNYRSTGHILGTAGALISNNAGRLGKTLWTADGHGDKVFVRGLWDGQEEARWVGQIILNACTTENIKLKDIAILVRAGFQTREFEENFIQMGIAYRVYGGLKFYDRQEIRDAIAYLRLLYQPNDDLAFERIINLPKRGVGPAALKQIYDIAKTYKCGCIPAIERVLDSQETFFKPKLRETLKEFIKKLQLWREQLKKKSPDEMVENILDDSGYNEMWKKESTIEANSRLENLKELINTIAEFENLEAFLDHVSLVTDLAEESSENTVTIMTMHAAKGLEFEVVFLPGWEEELFPSRKSIEESGTKGLEEERRLAYVGLTRARKKAFVSYASHRKMHGNWINSTPSIFVQQLPAEHIHTELDRAQEQRIQSQFQSQQKSPNFQLRRTLSQALSFTKKESCFAIGQKVFHEKFGEGRVVEIDGDKIGVSFNRSGFKKLVSSFLTALS